LCVINKYGKLWFTWYSALFLHTLKKNWKLRERKHADTSFNLVNIFMNSH